MRYIRAARILAAPLAKGIKWAVVAAVDLGIVIQDRSRSRHLRNSHEVRQSRAVATAAVASMGTAQEYRLPALPQSKRRPQSKG